jgi:aspartyl-tRNA synthetase
MHAYRSHHCGQLSLDHVGEQVKLTGWLARKRDHGTLLFVDLRDHYGMTQCLFNDAHADLRDLASTIRFESVVTITGTVVKRAPETVNANMATGAIEVVVESLQVESLADVLPMQVMGEQEFPEETRLRYRFLDLRREELHHNILLRAKIISWLRQEMTARDFVEMQTPILTASSPEGARDYLVPSRVHPGKFYALPQAPQQFKQLLMVSGFDRYFQIAPCFRDEDARADRSPGEFYQLDLEMAFVTQEDIFQTIEPVLHGLFTKFGKKTVTAMPFPRIPYREAMLHYGCDKPDLRNPIKIQDVSDIFASVEFAVFKNALAKGHVVRAVPGPTTLSKPRSFFDKQVEFAQSQGAPGLAYITILEDGTAKGPIAKFLDPAQLAQLLARTGCGVGDSVFFVCDEEGPAAKLAGKIRTQLGEELGLIDPTQFAFCWVVDFPFYEWDEETKSIIFSHNPFSMPQGGMAALEAAKNTEDLLAICAYQYDIVCNGIELSSGAIRNHKPEVMLKAFAIAGYTEEQVEERFGGLLRAFRFGAPPHGGIAPGIDRMVMMIADEPNIREVIAFPMNQQAQDLLMQAPAPATEMQLRELGIGLRKKDAAKPTVSAQ